MMGHGGLGITDLRHIGEGMDAKVYRAHSPELGPVAIKMPYDRSSTVRPLTPVRRMRGPEPEVRQLTAGSAAPAPGLAVLLTGSGGQAGDLGGEALGLQG